MESPGEAGQTLKSASIISKQYREHSHTEHSYTQNTHIHTPMHTQWVTNIHTIKHIVGTMGNLPYTHAHTVDD